MNHDDLLLRLDAAIKADKGIAQPYRNYAVKELAVLKAIIHEGKTTTNLTPPAGMPIQGDQCTCLPGAIASTCPVHNQPPR